MIVHANQSGNANYNPATQASRTITVNKADQTITFPDPGAPIFGDAPLTLSASSSSGLTVSYTVASGPATINGNVLAITGAGTIVVNADQAGNANFNAAPQVARTLTGQPANQTITFPNGIDLISNNFTGFLHTDAAAFAGSIVPVFASASIG